MKRDIISSAIGIVVFTLLCGILYPLVITARFACGRHRSGETARLVTKARCTDR